MLIEPILRFFHLIQRLGSIYLIVRDQNQIIRVWKVSIVSTGFTQEEVKKDDKVHWAQNAHLSHPPVHFEGVIFLKLANGFGAESFNHNDDISWVSKTPQGNKQHFIINELKSLLQVDKSHT